MTANEIHKQSRKFAVSPIRKYFIEPFISSNSPPWFDARGVAFGLLIGFGIPLGAQMVCLGLLRLILRFNVVIAFAFTWVNNPITLIPMYYAYYVLGSLLLGKPAVMTPADFHELMKPVLNAQYFWNSVHAFMILGGDLLVRWFLAALSIAIPAAMVGYFISYRVQQARCRSKAENLGISYRKLVRELEKEL
jgi:uncharacterized protein (DUF2062 family)